MSWYADLLIGESRFRSGRIKLMVRSGRPVIAITIGDPAGVGPEIVLGALRNEEIYNRAIPVVIGSISVLKRCMQYIGMTGLEILQVDEPAGARGLVGQVEVIEVSVAGLDDLCPGKVQAVGGKAADAFIRKACDLALAHQVDAIATAPISKESLRAAGIPKIGHTELFARYLATSHPLTLFVTGNMRVFFLSRHMSLREAIDYITEERVLGMIRRVNKSMQELGFVSPCIALAALNPHASDGGQFGDEEARILLPAILKAKAEGINVHGPIPADSVFHQALEGRFDCVISLYHDQGHIATKTKDFYRTVSVTLGLPVLRTSVDHGTAFDIAWQGKANSLSMETAIFTASDLLDGMKARGCFKC
jgi:4-hydroxythreonine-4-phosphate dehydrogenase